MIIRDDQHIRQYGWMRTRLDLKGNDLIVFSIIFGFSFASVGWYTGGRSGLAKWCGATTSGIDKNLKSLLNRKLILKEKSGEAFYSKCRYRCNFKEVERITGLDVQEIHTDNCSSRLEEQKLQQRLNQSEPERPTRYY